MNPRNRGFVVQTVPIGVQKKVGKQIGLIGLHYELAAYAAWPRRARA